MANKINYTGSDKWKQKATELLNREVGGVDVEANPDDVATEDLSKLRVEGTTYRVSSGISGSQTSTSSEDEGINTYTFTYDDGTTSAFNVRNGSKGSQGIQGPKGDTGEQGIQGIQGEQGIQGVKGDTGDAAGFGTPTATVDANVGTPSVSITSSGPDTAKIFNFEFHNLKGEKGTIPDLSAETIDTIDTIQTEYPTLTAGDKVSALFGKIKKFLSDLVSKKVDKAGDTMSGALTINGTSANTLDNMSYMRNLVAEENGELKWNGLYQRNVNGMYQVTGQNIAYIDSPLKVNGFIDSNNINGMYVTGNNGSFCNVETNDITLYGSTANRVPVINADKEVVSSDVTDTELGYLSGVTSAIQTQLNNKQNSLFIDNSTATDFNNITTPGWYWINPSITSANHPFSGKYGVLEVISDRSTGIILQRFTRYSDMGMAERLYVNSQWYAWNNKAYMWTDSEGGNIQIVSPSGTYSSQMDMYNDTTWRIYHSSPTATVAGGIYHSYNKTANLDYLDGVTSNIQTQLNTLKSSLTPQAVTFTPGANLKSGYGTVTAYKIGRICIVSFDGEATGHSQWTNYVIGTLSVTSLKRVYTVAMNNNGTPVASIQIGQDSNQLLFRPLSASLPNGQFRFELVFVTSS